MEAHTVYRGSAYILLGRLIDANDHMCIAHPAVDQKQCPPLCQPFWGVYPFWSSVHDIIAHPRAGPAGHEIAPRQAASSSQNDGFVAQVGKSNLRGSLKTFRGSS